MARKKPLRKYQPGNGEYINPDILDLQAKGDSIQDIMTVGNYYPGAGNLRNAGEDYISPEAGILTEETGRYLPSGEENYDFDEVFNFAPSDMDLTNDEHQRVMGELKKAKNKQSIIREHNRASQMFKPQQGQNFYIKREGGQILDSFKSAARFDQKSYKKNSGRRSKG